MYYKISSENKQQSLRSNENPLPLIPGMTVTVDIKTGRKSVLESLLSQLSMRSKMI